jgi:hypothetical protein
LEQAEKRLDKLNDALDKLEVIVREQAKRWDIDDAVSKTTKMFYAGIGSAIATLAGLMIEFFKK